MAVDWKLSLVNFSGALYTIFIIVGIALLNLFYTCPALYGSDNCGWTVFYAFIILSQIVVNLILFHYFNRRNQISFWRVKNTLILEDNNSFSPDLSQSRRQFTALNINGTDSGLKSSLINTNTQQDFALTDFNGSGRKRLNRSLERKDNQDSLVDATAEYNDVYAERHAKTKSQEENPKSILASNQTVREAPQDPNRYQHRMESNRLFASVDGIYRSDISPEQFEQMSTSESAALLSNEPKTTTKWCVECAQMTPRRCHHCPLCNICVLRKDHHCFLTGGCVGLANQRYFIVFLLWASIGSFYGLCFNFAYLNRFVASWYPWGWVYYIGPVAVVRWLFIGSETFFNMCLALMFSVSVASCLGALAFFCSQIFYTLNGYTMHDYHVGRLREQLESDGENYSERLALVFGRRWWLNFLIPQFWLPNEMTPAIARNIFVSISKDL